VHGPKAEPRLEWVRSGYADNVDVRVVLVAPRNPLNIGAAARAMANFGFSRLHVVSPYEVAFREARSAVGAAPLLADARDFSSVAEAAAECSLVVGTTSAAGRQLQHGLRRLEEGARLIKRHTGPVALLFGSEKYGLSNEDMSYCHWLVRIATVRQDLSMNLGQAVAVCLYELARSPAVKSAREGRRPASSGDLEQITRMLLQILDESGYLNPVTEQSSVQKVRRLVRRLPLADADAPMVLGFLRQILWRFHSPRS
jgi:tRNA/rRNA methyltransferase